MKKAFVIASIGALALLVQQTGRAQRAPSAWPSTGPTCASFLQSSGSDRGVLVSFTLGFVAGTNRERNGANQVMFTVAQTEARTLAFCTAHPQGPMADAAFALVDEVKVRQR